MVAGAVTDVTAGTAEAATEATAASTGASSAFETSAAAAAVVVVVVVLVFVVVVLVVVKEVLMAVLMAVLKAAGVLGGVVPSAQSSHMRHGLGSPNSSHIKGLSTNFWHGRPSLKRGSRVTNARAVAICSIRLMLAW